MLWDSGYTSIAKKHFFLYYTLKKSLSSKHANEIKIEMVYMLHLHCLFGNLHFHEYAKTIS